MGKIISIITDWGDGYGAGHVQRMASLCVALSGVPGVRAGIINSKKPGFLTAHGGMEFMRDLDPATDLIVRDMRDSTPEQMLILKQTAPVLAVDDIGEGRNHADFTLDLLPNPLHRSGGGASRDDCYLYGYNFISCLRGLDEETIPRDIDVLVYSGHMPGNEKFFTSILPTDARSVILGGGGRTLVNIRGDDECARMDYAGLLLRTKVLISHFGLSLYEAKLAGCSVLSLNPTAYHSSLADMVTGTIVDVNAGERAACDAGAVRRSCGELLSSHNRSGARPALMLAEAEVKLMNCRDFVVSLVAG